MTRAFATLFAIASMVFLLAMPSHAQVRGSSAPRSMPGITINNFNGSGMGSSDQVSHYDTAGNKIDAHDGMILQVGDTFYQYGTSYGCGFQYNTSGSPFCGFSVYSSADLVNWTNLGFLYDAAIPAWQTACSNNRGAGCFRPHMIYNAANNNYVLWINQAPDGSPLSTDALYVFTCTTPYEGCALKPNPLRIANPLVGDFSLFLDPVSGNAYIIYSKYGVGAIYIEQLNANFTDSLGTALALPNAASGDETPFMFYSEGRYFAGWGPFCTYCSTGTAAYVESAASPMGTYDNVTKLNSNSCNGQPRSVDVITANGNTTYLFSADQWNGEHNEGLANTYYQPLVIKDGVVSPFSCSAAVSIAGLTQKSLSPPSFLPNQTDAGDKFLSYYDGNISYWRMQTFVPSVPTLSKVQMPIGQRLVSGTLDASPTVELVTVNKSNNPVSVLATATLVGSDLSWAQNLVTATFNYSGLKPGTTYGLVVKNNGTQGQVSLGLYTGTKSPYPAGVERVSTDRGKTWITEPHRALMFSTFQ